MGHDVGGFARALGDEYVDAGRGGTGARARRLENDFVGGLIGHGDGGNFADLQPGAEEFDARGAERIALQQGNLQLALAEAEHDGGLLGLFHQQAGGGGAAGGGGGG